jgi:hypothetical protein
VLVGLAQREGRKEIALRLHISERTIRAYLTNLYTKLNVDSRSALLTLRRGHGCCLLRFSLLFYSIMPFYSLPRYFREAILATSPCCKARSMFGI